LRAIGIQPDAIICRSEIPIDADLKEKIALFTDVPREAVVSVPDVDSIYEVPLMLEASGLGKVMAKHFELDEAAHTPEHGAVDSARGSDQASQGHRADRDRRQVHRAADAYLSVIESLKHAAFITTWRSTSAGSHRKRSTRATRRR